MDSCVEKSVGTCARKRVDSVSKAAANLGTASDLGTAADLGATTSLNRAILKEISIYNYTLYALLYTIKDK
jgi:hypothetical protein